MYCPRPKYTLPTTSAAQTRCVYPGTPSLWLIFSQFPRDEASKMYSQVICREWDKMKDKSYWVQTLTPVFGPPTPSFLGHRHHVKNSALHLSSGSQATLNLTLVRQLHDGPSTAAMYISVGPLCYGRLTGRTGVLEGRSKYLSPPWPGLVWPSYNLNALQFRLLPPEFLSKSISLNTFNVQTSTAVTNNLRPVFRDAHTGRSTVTTTGKTRGLKGHKEHKEHFVM